MNRLMKYVGVFLFIVLDVSAAPPVDGTIFVDPDIVTSTDPSLYQGISYTGTGNRVMFDRRTNTFETYNAFLFIATYSDGLIIEIQVNPEFTTVEAASDIASFYGNEVGRLPTLLRTDVQTMWIHMGVYLFGGGNNNLLIHTGQGELYIADGFLEEVLIHEATHTSLDAAHAASAGWLAAQVSDAGFISTYAQDNPTREDIAESFLPYFALKYKRDRISDLYASVVAATIPNRIAYFDAQNFNLFPYSLP